MNSPQEYIDYAIKYDDIPKSIRINNQWHDAINYLTITCECGQTLSLISSFRCLYCGEWFCKDCAEKHFGISIKEWHDNKK